MMYGCILADPPWALTMAGKRLRKKEGRKAGALDYPTMATSDICDLPIGKLALPHAHLWLWTTNQHLEDGFRVMRAWGFKYLLPVHWIKPSGMGNWLVHRTQTILLGYQSRCVFPLDRYKPNLIFAPARRHSQKPLEAYEFIEAISPGPRLELFARNKRHGWDSWGNEVDSDINLISTAD